MASRTTIRIVNHHTQAEIVVQLRPAVDTIFSVKELVLATTTWFVGLDASHICVFDARKTLGGDSPTLVRADSTLIVQLVSRGNVCERECRRACGPTVYSSIRRSRHCVAAVVEAFSEASGSPGTLPPFNHQVLPIGHQRGQVGDTWGKDDASAARKRRLHHWEKNEHGDQGSSYPSSDSKTSILSLPLFIHNLSHVIIGFTQDRQTTVLRDWDYDHAEEAAVNDHPDYVNTCNDFVIFAEDILLARFISARGTNKQPAFTFLMIDFGQSETAKLLKGSEDRSALELLAEGKDTDRLDVFYCCPHSTAWVFE
ncbi:hypothetical protein BDK51DRAFT_49796 [Blyttiomyces helicus]|uniref:Uncharacterized protein n=1 Tax=Blyttiomyces helicus TaxID=388810 RepID=A0A4P9WC38_9FUNG|nr:hypothetical protein BDK51DRAFT_49796 [Blyttiomyces helicus]|eukprot:RKO90209.1 hypothetical protein BDK51DRAFT_49796 [Blyttiomyces helicus]